MATYDRRLELDEGVYRRTNAVITKALQGSEHLMRTELGDALEAAGIAARGQRLGHIVHRAEVEGLICSGAMRGNKHTYALLDERAPVAKRLTRDEALAELTIRYFTSHGPALVKDFAWWSGLTVADAKLGVEMNRSRLMAEDFDGKTYWSGTSAAPAVMMKNPAVLLLPNYDEYLIGYRDHSASLDASLSLSSPFVYDMLARHIIVLNGRVIGGWRSKLTKGEVRIETKLSVALGDEEQEALRVTAQRYGRFLGGPVSVA